MIGIQILMSMYAALCFAVGIYLSDSLFEKEKITRGNVVTYIVAFPGFVFGLLLFLLVSFLFLLFDLINNRKEKINTWWNTPIKK